MARTVLRVQTTACSFRFHLRHDSGGHSVGETPVPFPNTEVKPDTPMVLTGKPVGRVGRCQGHVFFISPLLGVFAYLGDPAGIHVLSQERLSSVLTMQTTLYRVKV